MRPDVKHYKTGAIEPIDYIISNDLSFAEGNVVKYITRYKHKGTPVEDLKKARDYINFILESLEEEANKLYAIYDCKSTALFLTKLFANKYITVVSNPPFYLYNLLDDDGIKYRIDNDTYLLYLPSEVVEIFQGRCPKSDKKTYKLISRIKKENPTVIGDKTEPTTTTFSTYRVSIEDLIEALKRGPVLLTNSILLYEILRDKVEYTISNCKYIMYFKNKKYTVRMDIVTNDTREYTLVREQDKITIGGIA